MHGMDTNVTRWYVAVVRVLLLLTAVAKLLSVAGEARFLAVPDPVFLLPTRAVLLMAALTELAVAAYLTWGRSPTLKHGILLWLACVFLVYRGTLRFASPSTPCRCLGWVGDLVPVPPHFLERGLEAVLIGILIGSGLSLWRLRRIAPPRETPAEPSPVRAE